MMAVFRGHRGGRVSDRAWIEQPVAGALSRNGPGSFLDEANARSLKSAGVCL